MNHQELESVTTLFYTLIKDLRDNRELRKHEIEVLTPVLEDYNKDRNRLCRKGMLFSMATLLLTRPRAKPYRPLKQLAVAMPGWLRIFAVFGVYTLTSLQPAPYMQFVQKLSTIDDISVQNMARKIIDETDPHHKTDTAKRFFNNGLYLEEYQQHKQQLEQELLQKRDQTQQSMRHQQAHVEEDINAMLYEASDDSNQTKYSYRRKEV